jgi:hypothetical protein
MTPCYICSHPISEIIVGPDLKPLPCSKCLSIVRECVGDFDKDFWEDTDAEENEGTLEEFLELHAND